MAATQARSAWQAEGEQLSEIDLQYSPSRWSNRISGTRPETRLGTADAVVEDHCRRLALESWLVRNSVSSVNMGGATVAELAIPHSQQQPKRSDEACLDIFYASAAGDSPVLVYLHGGYWQALSRDASAWLATTATRLGATMVAVGYDLCPHVSFDALVQQVCQAVADVLRRFSGSPVVLCGHSAGAHLAAVVLATDFETEYGVSSDVIRGALLVSGVYDLVPIVDTYVNEALSLTRDAARLLSPQWMASSGAIARNGRCIVIAVGEHDSPAFISQSEDYYELITRAAGANADVEYCLVPGVDHFRAIEKLSDVSYLLTSKLREIILSASGIHDKK